MRITMKKIAELAGVSVSTVSFIINKKDKHISQATRDRVNQIIAEHDYRPNMLAKGLMTNKSNTIGLLLPDITNPFYAQIAKGVEDVASERGYTIFLCNSYNDTEKEMEYIKIMQERHVDGIILSQINDANNEALEYLISNKMTYVFLDRYDDVEEKHAVFVDNELGGKLAAQHLLSLGHTKIGCIASIYKAKNVDERILGFQQTLIENDIIIPPTQMLFGDLTVEGGKSAARKLLNCGVTAIFCCNDLMAIGVYEFARENGIKIPEQLSVIGYDDIEFSCYLTPPLTTIKQPIYEIGSSSVLKLYNLLDKHDQSKIDKLSTSIIVRGSTAKRQNKVIKLKRNNKICVLGSINMDVSLNVSNLPKTGETIFSSSPQKVFSPGGKGFNQALTAVKTGSEVSFIGAVGDDDNAKNIVDIMQKEGIDSKWVQTFENAATGEAFIVIQEDGKNFIVVNEGANSLVHNGQIQTATSEFSEYDIFLSQFEVPIDTIKNFFEKAKELGKLTILNPAPAQAIPDDLLANTDILIPNETEMEHITGCSTKSLDEIKKGAEKLLEKGVKLLIVTLGKAGVAVITKNDCIQIAANNEVTAVDSTGAGDSFIGALSNAINIDEFLDVESLKESIDFAQSIAEKVIMKSGAYESIRYL